VGLPRTYLVCLLIVKTLISQRPVRGALRSLLATGKHSAPARSHGDLSVHMISANLNSRWASASLAAGTPDVPHILAPVGETAIAGREILESHLRALRVYSRREASLGNLE
jgi:hypothetical protein